MVDLVIGIIVLIAYTVLRVFGASSEDAVKETKTLKSIMKTK